MDLDALPLIIALQERDINGRSGEIRPARIEMAFGQVTRKQPLQLVSQMAGYGVIFSDGSKPTSWSATPA